MLSVEFVWEKSGIADKQCIAVGKRDFLIIGKQALVTTQLGLFFDKIVVQRISQQQCWQLFFRVTKRHKKHGYRYQNNKKIPVSTAETYQS